MRKPMTMADFSSDAHVYKQIQRDTNKYNEISWNIINSNKQDDIFRNTDKYEQIDKDIQTNTMKYTGIQGMCEMRANTLKR